jgi:MFS family permease
MTRVTAELVVDGSSAAALTSPRRGLVLEEVESTAATADGARRTSFRQAEGPLASYRRAVDVRPLADGQYRARQTVDLRVGLPWWSWLLALPLRLSLGKATLPVRTPKTAEPSGGDREDRLPWWAPPHRLNRRQAVVMATLAALVSVQGFLAALLPETLTYAASEMHVGTFGQGAVFAAVELSALPALFALVVADRRGRRAVVLWATGAAAVLSELGGFATSMSWLTVTQVSAGALVAAAGVAAIVVAVEEVPRGCRAWAVGVLGMAGGFGGGIPLLLLPLAGTGTAGWRWLYFVSLLTLPVVAVCSRQLPESRRWEAAELSGPLPAEQSAELTAEQVSGRAGLSRIARQRLLLVCAGAMLFALFAAPASLFQTEFLHQERHYSALGISVLQQLAGTLGALGVLFGGRLADTHGRRPVAVVSVSGATIAVLWSYLAHGWLLWFATTSAQFFLYATAPVLGVYGAELFATRSRARSAGLVAAASAVGGVAGLLAVGGLAGHFSTLGPALGVLAVGPILLVVLLLVRYPETAEVALEELAPEAAGLLPQPERSGELSPLGPPGEPCLSRQ